jgi:predicted nucleic acid-binding protein
VKAVLDACVLFPPVLRETLLGAAAAGGFEPLWSARILEEWARATRRLPQGAEASARAEIERLRAAWPGAEVAADEDLEASLSLPDPADRHVLATAIAGGAAALVTLNRADFPARTLARAGVLLRHPDGLLVDLDAGGLDLLPVAEAVRERAGRLAGLRQLLKRAGLPQLGKALAARAADGR